MLSNYAFKILRYNNMSKLAFFACLDDGALETFELNAVENATSLKERIVVDLLALAFKQLDPEDNLETWRTCYDWKGLSYDIDNSA